MLDVMPSPRRRSLLDHFSVIKDARLFELLERSGKQLIDTKFECPDADEVIHRAVEGMKVELEHNLWEKDLKRVVAVSLAVSLASALIGVWIGASWHAVPTGPAIVLALFVQFVAALACKRIIGGDRPAV